MSVLQLYSYLYGFLGTDGAIKIYNNEIQAIVLEVSSKDKEDIIKLSKKIKCTFHERIRNTNFKKEYSSCYLYINDNELIKYLKDNNFPIKNKTNEIKKPSREYDENYFWLGVIDGDGSLGIKKDGHPFINLTTKSEYLKEDFLDYIEKYTNFRPSVSRNKRDNIYNITLGSKKAQIIAQKIYDNKDFCLQRKYNEYLRLAQWEPKNMKGIKRIKWTKEEEADLFLLSNEDFMLKYPNRTYIAIKNKKLKMKKGE